MAVGGFTTLASFAGSRTANQEWLASDIDFSADDQTPANFEREIQVQLSSATASNVQITLDGGVTWLDINNGDTLVGLATFTFLVDNATLLNFRQTTGTIVVTIMVAAS